MVGGLGGSGGSLLPRWNRCHYGQCVPLDYPDPDLADERIRLREWRLEDGALVREVALADPSTVTITTVPADPSGTALEDYVHRQWSRQPSGQGLSLVIETREHDRPCGNIVALHRHQPGVVGIGYWLAPRARGAGLARRAVTLLSGWLLAEPDIYRVEAHAAPQNTASVRTLQRAGFLREGLLRSYLQVGDGRADAVVLSRVRGDAAS